MAERPMDRARIPPFISSGLLSFGWQFFALLATHKLIRTVSNRSLGVVMTRSACGAMAGLDAYDKLDY